MISATSTSTLTTGVAAPGTTATAADTTAAQDRFMKLLVAQLKNQDPMSPMDNAQMTSQMAQINTVTGIQQVNDTLKSIASQFASLQVLQGASMVGHDVLLEGNALAPVGGQATGAMDLAGRAESVKIEILSPGGQVLDTINSGALEAGRHYFNWDASSYQGTGNPSFKITATLGGKPIGATPLSRDTVVSVGNENGAMSVQLQGRGSVAYDSIKAIL